MSGYLRAFLLAATAALAACSGDVASPTAAPAEPSLSGYHATTGRQDDPEAPPPGGDTTGIDINDPSRPMFGGGVGVAGS